MRVYLFLVLCAFCAVINPFSELLYLILEFCKFWSDGENCKNRTANARGLYLFDKEVPRWMYQFKKESYQK